MPWYRFDSIGIADLFSARLAVSLDNPEGVGNSITHDRCTEAHGSVATEFSQSIIVFRQVGVEKIVRKEPRKVALK